MITFTSDTATKSAARNALLGQVSEDYFSLVHWLRSFDDFSNVKHKSIGVTSCTRGAGVSTVALNLAKAASQISDQAVLLLDLSETGTGRSRLNRETDVLAEVARASDFVRTTSIPNLNTLTVSSLDDVQALSVDSGRINDLLEALKNEFGFIVVDLPAVESSLCFVTAGLLSGVLVVMEAERTRFEIANRAKQRLLDARANLLGVILNKHPQHLPNWLEARL
jgi:Mrp family chromosome partitioning ATPase